MSVRSAGAAGRRLFVYGTLMFPEVLHAVCGVHLPMRPATLGGYRRHRVRGQRFPAIVAAAGSSTDGALVDGVTPALWRRLDAFESDFYIRVAVTVACAGEPRLAAFAYVVSPAQRRALSDEAWSPEEFRASGISAYLARET